MRKDAKQNFARTLRKQMTDAEHRLWYHLRNRAFLNQKFRRQHPVGPYIVDFVCLHARVIIELDGGQHANSPSDAYRDAHLQREGFRVLRFWNNEVLDNLEGVAWRIEQELLMDCPHPNLPPQAGEGADRAS